MRNLAAAALILAAVLTGTAGRHEPIPACEEDAVLVGIGQYHDGRWDAYQCGPAVDDIR